MRSNDLLQEAYRRIPDLVRSAVAELGAEQLAWRPDPQANTIGWLVWHLSRVQDAQVSDLAGVEQAWTDGGWASRFGLPADFTDTGYGHTPEQVAMIVPASAAVLVDYQDEVTDRCVAYLEHLDADDLQRVIDRSYDPPVTVGVRLVSVLSDALQHAGQAAYVRGLCLRL